MPIRSGAGGSGDEVPHKFPPKRAIVQEYGGEIGDELGPEFKESALNLADFLTYLKRQPWEIRVVLRHYKEKMGSGGDIQKPRSYYHPSGKAFGALMAKETGQSAERVGNQLKKEGIEFAEFSKGIEKMDDGDPF